MFSYIVPKKKFYHMNMCPCLNICNNPKIIKSIILLMFINNSMNFI